MSYTLRILQRFDPRHEKEFLELEKQFAELEKQHPELPQGRRMKPFSGSEPCNTLVWQGEFPTLDEAQAALTAFSSNDRHEELLAKQLPYFRDVRIELYENLDG